MSLIEKQSEPITEEKPVGIDVDLLHKFLLFTEE
jgi:hypothetical protein